MDRRFQLAAVVIVATLAITDGCSPTTAAQKQVKSNSDGSYSCKDDKAWTNGVRRLLTDSLIEELDALDGDTGKQSGKIDTDCSGGSNPKIFDESKVSTWCASGCAPLPQDYDTYWEPDYNVQSVTTDLEEAPIKPIRNYTVTVNCRDGFAPKNGNGQTDTAYCSDTGWQPALSNIVVCASGCKDVRNDMEYGSSENLRSTTLGGTPFNIGDVLTFSCDSGYTMSGSEYLTCASTQTWVPDSPPTCEMSYETTSDAEKTALSLIPLLILLLVFR